MPPQPIAEATTEQPAARPDQTIYVLDKDLVRFAKFVASALAVFITIGATLYGFSVKEAADKVRESADKVRDVADKVGDTADKVRTQKEAVDNQAKSIAATDEQIKKSKDDVDRQVKILQDTAQQINNTVKEVMADRERVKDLLHLTERDYLRAHNIVGQESSVDTNATGLAPGFTVPQIARLYDFPTEFDGTGQTIGLIELGGGYRDSDLVTYFSKLKLPKPTVTSVGVDGARNSPGHDVDAQVTLDIEVAGAVAPRAHVVVYFAPNTNQGFLNAINKAVHDDVNHPSVISISWGSSEGNWSVKTLEGINTALRSASLAGISVVVAAGDNGVTDGVTDGKAHVDFPASSPYVLAVGGTRIKASETAITSEVVWNDAMGGGGATGGGVSDVFALPEWQQNANVPPRAGGGTGRGLPDVAANADPSSGYVAYVAGKWLTIGGTAAATPLWAGLMALMNQGVGHNVGFINPILYQKIGPSGVFRAIVQGDNSSKDVKGFAAGPGWSAAVGWGSPNGRKLLDALRQ
jgi:kumamolisin